MPDKFVHLHGHSEYSLLDGFSKLPKLIAKVKEIEQPAIGLSDHGSLSGVHRFYKACVKEKIKPIVGYEAYLTERRLIKNPSYKSTTHLLLMAKNKIGYHNLIKIASSASSEGFYYKPRVDMPLLEQFKSGIVCTTACIASEFNKHILGNRIDKAVEHLMVLKDIFGDDLYIELQNHGIKDQQILFSSGLKLAKEYGVKTIATNDYHYVDKKDAHYQDIVFCGQMKKSLTDGDRLKLTEEHYIKTREEMEVAIDCKEALDNTVLLAEECDLNITSSGPLMIKYENEEQEFDKLIKQGVYDRFEFLPEEYTERLKYEVRVIKEARLLGYFLTVSDYIKWARDNGVMVGPGRGSVGGSLVGYLLGIHDVDPIKYKLLFSRFYNAGRKGSLPDVDTDFAKKDINRVLEYITNKYGDDRVAAIGTFQKIAGRGAIKLICRVNNIPFDLSNQYSALVDQKKHKKLIDAMQSAEFKTLYDNDAQFKRIVDEAVAVENTAVSQGVHASGILIGNQPLTEIIPIRVDKNSSMKVSAWDMEDVESVGIIKFDFLSLSTLDVIRDCMDLANLEFDYRKIPLGDEKAFQLISTTNNVGVFQLSSTGISALANQMGVRSIEDIAVVVALYRPGPLGSGMHLTYLKRRFGQEPIEYINKKMKTALEPTLGVLVYQEQVTQLCMDLAGFSEEEADELRKVMGKKLIEKEGGKDQIKKIGANFVKKCVDNGIDKEIAKIVWGQLNEFGGYGFNRSHATSYALLTYYTAYLKAHYPVEFMTALLNDSIGNNDDMKTYLTECKRLNIEIVPPDYTHSKDFSCKNGKILFGLGAIKGISTSACDKIGGRKFESFIDFCTKVLPETDMLISLIESGALDSLDYTRKAKKLAAESLMADIRSNTRKNNPKQKTLFSQKYSYRIENIAEYNDKELAVMELNRLGVYLGFSPLDPYKNFATKFTHIPNDKDIPYNQDVKVLCIPIKMKTFLTKTSNQEMAICNCETLGSSIELLVFPKAYEQFKNKVEVGVPILVNGKVTAGESFSLKAQHIDLME